MVLYIIKSQTTDKSLASEEFDRVTRTPLKTILYLQKSSKWDWTQVITSLVKSFPFCKKKPNKNDCT